MAPGESGVLVSSFAAVQKSRKRLLLFARAGRRLTETPGRETARNDRLEGDGIEDEQKRRKNRVIPRQEGGRKERYGRRGKQVRKSRCQQVRTGEKRLTLELPTNCA